jgi:hypothetical protein
MKIDYKKLRHLIRVHILPQWEKGNGEWDMRRGGGEKYIQEKVLSVAAAQLKDATLRQNTKEAVLNAIMVPSNNLLSQFEKMQSKLFIQHIEEGELRANVLSLLFGAEDVESRLRKFIEWAKVGPIPGENKKSGFSPQVASYLLAMSDPLKYAFCKPSVYKNVVRHLVEDEERKTDSVGRIFHCKEIYSNVLSLLQREYNLQEGNLLDVHSIFFKINWEGWETEEAEDEEIIYVDKSLHALLMDKHNVILYGPPGTGKTWKALLFSRFWKGKNGSGTVRQVTFHPSYCYEDFVEGFRPAKDGSGFHLKDGIFKRVCQEAVDDQNKNYLFVIDEINRGDVARILGELITIIEGDKRGEKHSVLLQQSGENFFVPDNLYILGTMNTADKSISLMDLAIRRRFLFYPCLPDPDLLEQDRTFLSEIEGVRLSNLMVGLNQRLVEVGVDRDRILGHSYFLIQKGVNAPLEVLMNRMRYEIIPLIEEYCYADRSVMSRVLGDLVEDFGAVNGDIFDDSSRFVDVVRGLQAE